MFAAMAGAAHAAATDDADLRDAPYAQVQRLVDVDHGRRLNLYCLGTGSPTVVFDAGLGGDTSSWDTVQAAVAQHTQACAYDRAGLGFSDPATRPNTSANAVDDLQRLLPAAGIKPPYILVGHSAGGLNMRLFAYEHEAEVAGMVLVDPSHEDEEPDALQILDQAARAKQEQADAEQLEKKSQCVVAAESRRLVRGSPLYIQCIPGTEPHWSDAMNRAMARRNARPSYQRATYSELKNFDTESADELRTARHNLGDMPLIVLTSAPRPPKPGQSQAERERLNVLWETLHDQIAAESTRGASFIVLGAGHFIQWDKPQAVVDAILKVLAQARGQSPAASTGEGGH
jgi:pimeloyl-ACP methyl ester carboxylesterase